MKNNDNNGLADIVKQSIQRREDFLASLRSGASMLKLVVRGQKLTCVYKKHDSKTLTVGSDTQTAQLLRGGTFNLSGPFKPEDITFNLNEVESASI
jgi:hypothetical protein